MGVSCFMSIHWTLTVRGQMLINPLTCGYPEFLDHLSTHRLRVLASCFPAAISHEMSVSQESNWQTYTHRFSPFLQDESIFLGSLPFILLPLSLSQTPRPTLKFSPLWSPMSILPPKKWCGMMLQKCSFRKQISMGMGREKRDKREESVYHFGTLSPAIIL